MTGELAHSLAAGIDGIQVPLAHQYHLVTILAGEGLVDGAWHPAPLGGRVGKERLYGQLARCLAARIETVQFPLPGPDQIPLAGGGEAAHRVTLIVGELTILTAGQVPLPDVEIAAALAQVIECLTLVIPDGIAGGHSVFGQLVMGFAIEQPEAGDGKRVLMFAKRLIHARHLIGQLLAMGASQGGGQRLCRRQGAATDRGPVEGAGLESFRHEVIRFGRGQSLAAQQQLLAIGAECLGQIGAGVTGQSHHLAPCARYHEHIFVAI